MRVCEILEVLPRLPPSNNSPAIDTISNSERYHEKTKGNEKDCGVSRLFQNSMMSSCFDWAFPKNNNRRSRASYVVWSGPPAGSQCGRRGCDRRVSQVWPHWRSDRRVSRHRRALYVFYASSSSAACSGRAYTDEMNCHDNSAQMHFQITSC